MSKPLAALGLALCLLAPAAQAAPDPSVRMSVAICDANSPQHCEAPFYAGAVAIAVGGAHIAATKGVAADCTTGGVVTLTLSDGSSLSWTVAPGHQNQPYSVIAIPASTATCAYYGLR